MKIVPGPFLVTMFWGWYLFHFSRLTKPRRARVREKEVSSKTNKQTNKQYASPIGNCLVLVFLIEAHTGTSLFPISADFTSGRRAVIWYWFRSRRLMVSTERIRWPVRAISAWISEALMWGFCRHNSSLCPHDENLLGAYWNGVANRNFYVTVDLYL